MKTLSRTFRFVVLGVIVTVVVVSCCTFGLLKDTTSHIEVGNSYVELGRTKYRTYVDWKNKHDFDKALAQVHANNGKICVCVLESSGTPYPHNLNNDCPRNYRCYSENIRTVKVTKSKAADKIAAGEAVANDPNVMHRVQSPVPADIIKVLGTLK